MTAINTAAPQPLKINRTGFKSNFTIEASVFFLDLQKAEQYFINSQWSEVYYKYKSLNELGEQIALDLMSVDSAIYNNSKELRNCKAIEGFSIFIEMKNGFKNHWVSHCDDYGTIQVFISSVQKTQPNLAILNTGNTKDIRQN